MIQAIDDLLWNWARWRLQRDSVGGSVRSTLGFLITDGISVENMRDSLIPINDLDAGVIERYVMALDPVLRRVIGEFYLWTNPIDQKARNCSCSTRTFYNRLNKAHELIEQMQRNYNENGIEPKPWPSPPKEKT